MCQPMRRCCAFTLVEILIVVMILGILAALVIPQFSSAADESRQAALRDQLRVVREQISVFRAQHREVWPGLQTGGAVGDADLFLNQLLTFTDVTGVASATKDATHRYGPYLQAAPANPISGLSSVLIDSTAGTPTPDNTTGWIYQPLTGRLYANTTAQDSNGNAYFGY